MVNFLMRHTRSKHAPPLKCTAILFSLANKQTHRHHIKHKTIE